MVFNQVTCNCIDGQLMLDIGYILKVHVALVISDGIRAITNITYHRIRPKQLCKYRVSKSNILFRLEFMFIAPTRICGHWLDSTIRDITICHDIIDFSIPTMINTPLRDLGSASQGVYSYCRISCICLSPSLVCCSSKISKIVVLLMFFFQGSSNVKFGKPKVVWTTLALNTL